MSVNENTTKSESGATSQRVRLRLWNPRISDESDNDIQAPRVLNEEPVIEEIYLPKDRPQVNIENAIRHEDLPQCRPLSECHDIHLSDPVSYDMMDHGQNYRHRFFHERWSEQEVKVFTNKYLNLQSNREKRFDLMAKALPDKTSADCRQFYYLYKHILEFKKPERERKQIEKERKQSLIRLKEPCGSRLRSGKQASITARAADRPSKKYNKIIKSKQTSRPVFVRNGAKTEEQKSELIRDLSIAQGLNIPPASIPFTSLAQENDLSNLNLLAQVCINGTQLQNQPSKTIQEDKQDPKKERKRSYNEAKLEGKTSMNQDCKQTSKRPCHNKSKLVLDTNKDVQLQTPLKVSGKKRKHQESHNGNVVAGQKKTRLGRPIMPPLKMNL